MENTAELRVGSGQPEQPLTDLQFGPNPRQLLHHCRLPRFQCYNPAKHSFAARLRGHARDEGGLLG